MNIFATIFLILFSLNSGANQDFEKSWQEFKKQHNEWAGSPTGYFAIQHMVTLSAGESAFLSHSQNKKDAQWSKEAPKAEDIKVSYSGHDAILSSTKIKPVDLLKMSDRKMELENGLIVRVSPLNESKLKVWLYNPEMDSRKIFKGLSFFPYNEKGVVRAKLKKFDTPQGISYVDSREEKGTMYVVGKLSFSIDKKDYEVKAYSYDSSWKTIETPMIFITDNTSGKSTYGGGRVVEVELLKKDSEEVIINFNKAYAFLCVHSKYYNCPIGLTTLLNTDLKYGEKLLNLKH